eukprot:2285554-Prymnesium_polylepis.1
MAPEVAEQLARLPQRPRVERIAADELHARVASLRSIAAAEWAGAEPRAEPGKLLADWEPEPPLPDGWQQATAPDGKAYSFSAAGQTTWERPRPAPSPAALAGAQAGAQA